MNSTFDNQTVKRLFYAFLIIHAIIWVLLPTFMRHALSPDAIEAVVWSHQWQWGYDKNPWFVALITRLAILLGGESGFGFYFFQQVFITMAFWSIWQLTKNLSHEPYALIASLMLSATSFFMLSPQLDNDNYILMGLWPLSALCFYYAYKENKLGAWLCCSIVLALATMTKYNSILLIVAYALFLLIHKERRRYFLSPYLYLAAILYVLIILPNIIWLFQHDFISIRYAFQRAGINISWKEVILGNLNFLQFMAVNFLPALGLLALGIAWKKPARFNNSISPTAISFIFWTGVFPFILVLLIAIFGKMVPKTEWGVNFIGLWGSALLLFFKPSVTKNSLRRFLIGVLLLLLLWPIGYIIAATVKQTAPWKGNYPAEEIATSVQNIWWAHYHKPLRYVAGERHLAGYVSFYSKDKPSVLMEYDTHVSPWIDIKKMHCYGAVFVQDDFFGFWTNTPEKFPEPILRANPRLIVLPLQYFNFYHNRSKSAHVQLLIGLLPPDKNCNSHSN